MNKPKVIYFFDALCGWCYGFTDVMEQLHTTYKDRFDFEIYSGGLFTGERVGYINDIAGYIKQGAYKSVEQRTGVKFGNSFLKEALEHNNMFMDSIPAGKALYIIREEKPLSAFEFGSRLLKLFYRDGISPTDLDGIAQLAESFSVSPEALKKKMLDPKYDEKIQNEYKMVANIGIRGYPSIVLQDEKEMKLIANGYADFDQLAPFLES